MAKYSFASWVDAVALDRNIRMNAETFRKKTGVQAVVWTFMQGAMLSVCLDESGESYMNAIEELKEKTSTPSDVYSQIRKKINEKVDEMLFDSSNEDGMNQKLVEKPLVKKFIQCFKPFWKKRVEEAKKTLKKKLNQE